MLAISFATVKSLHIIFVVTWFAGLFYIFRLFIYQREAQDKEEPAKSILTEQYKLMSWRLWYIITWPSAIITLITASGLLIMNPAFFSANWMHMKLFLVLLLYMYQIWTQKLFAQMQKDSYKHGSFKLRLLNEVPTVILISVVFLVVNKNQVDWIWGTIGIVGIAFLLGYASKRYKDYRELKGNGNENEEST